jgi:uncharacterized protein (TIGR02444 family)
MADTEAERGSPFWRFSLGFYRQPGVADACIALQDGCGVDVNILLFFLWLAIAKRRIGLADAQAVCGKAGGWRDDVVVPLRTLRRKLKDASSLVEATATEMFRTRIKAVELEAERLQQEALFGLAAGLTTESTPTVEAAARANVAAYEHAMARSFTPGAIAILLGALPATAGPR